MALIAGLLPHREQAIARDQTLPQLVIDRRRRGPRAWPPFARKADEDLRVQRIGLSSTRERLGVAVQLGRIEDGDSVAGCVHGDSEGDPLGAGSFEHDAGLGWVIPVA